MKWFKNKRKCEHEIGCALPRFTVVDYDDYDGFDEEWEAKLIRKVDRQFLKVFYYETFEFLKLTPASYNCRLSKWTISTKNTILFVCTWNATFVSFKLTRKMRKYVMWELRAQLKV